MLSWSQCNKGYIIAKKCNKGCYIFYMTPFIDKL